MKKKERKARAHLHSWPGVSLSASNVHISISSSLLNPLSAFSLPTTQIVSSPFSLSLSATLNNTSKIVNRPDMAEESQNPAASSATEAVVSDVPDTPEPESAEKPSPPATEDALKPAPPTPEADEDHKIADQQPIFKEETNVVSELPESQRKALDELKKLIQDALNAHEFSSPQPPPPPKEEEKKSDEEEKKPEEEEIPAPEEPAKTEKVEETEKPVEEVKTEEAVVVVEEVVVVQVEEVSPAAAVDEEKTVEAIAETIVSVAAHAPAATEEEEPCAVEAAAPPPPPEEVFIWGIPLLGDERSDVILLKFLRARDFKVKESLAMIKKCVRWRKEFEVDSLMEEDLGTDYDKVVFAHGSDKEGRPVVYNVFGEFKDKELYQSTFSDAEKQRKFLKWLVQFLEKTIRKLDFSPTGVSSFVLVNDLRNSPGYGKREFYKIINKYFALLQDNYPEFVAKQVCINVSRWYLAYSWVYISVFTPRSKSKFVFASSSKATETLFRYVTPEQVPVQYGGHSRAGEFTTEDAITEVTLKPCSKHTVEFSFKEACSLVWELRVIGWECTYEAQFIPEEGYTVLVSKPRKMSPNDEPIICDTFKIGEPGKVVLTIDNHTSKKKKLLYRSKNKVSESD